jgi:hypothetical protein
MAADPIPVDGVALSDSKSSIIKADAYRVDGIGVMDALEPKAGVVGIVAKCL